MVAYLSFTKTSNYSYISALADFMEDNGWSISANNGAGTLGGTKAGKYLTLVMNSSSGEVWGGSTIDSIASLGQRLGYSWNNGYTVYFVSSGNNLFLFHEYSSIAISFFTITDKIGSWADGTVLCGNYQSNDEFLNGGMRNYLFFKNGAWMAKNDSGTASGNLFGSRGYDPIAAGPNPYNAAIVPIPILMSQRADFNSDYLRPIGFVPGVYRAFGGHGMYNQGDIVTISGTDYVFFPSMGIIIALGEGV